MNDLEQRYQVDWLLPFKVQSAIIINFFLADLKDLLRYGRNTQIVQYEVGGLKNPNSFTETQYFFEKIVKILFYACKSWGYDPIWYFSYTCRKSCNLSKNRKSIKKAHV